MPQERALHFCGLVLVERTEQSLDFFLLLADS